MSFNALEKKIKENAQKYYTDGSQSMTDAEFDSAVSELKKSKPDSELFRTGWGYNPNENNSGKKFKHRYGLVGSLDKVHNWEELQKDLRDREIVASLKLDGLSVVLYYIDGELDQALTRGDGKIGIDITDKVLFINSKLKQIDKTFTGGVRGEILMSYPAFENYAKDHEDAKNPRNTTAGLINAKEISTDLRLLDIVFYKVVGCNEDRFDNYVDMLNYIESQFYPYVVNYENVSLFEKAIMHKMNDLRSLWYGHYPADGIVLARNDLGRLTTNETGNMNSDETNETIYTFVSQAFKFPAETKEAKVECVEWSLSKTKYLIPKVKIEPTHLSGTTVQYTAGFNAEYIMNSKIGPGAVVEICKSGEIIPDIQSVVKTSDEVKLPTICPFCGEYLEWKGVHLFCPNNDCGHSKMTDLLIWCSKLVPIDGLGDKIREKFFTEIYGEDYCNVDQIMKYPVLTRAKVPDIDKGKQYQLFRDSLLALFRNKFNIVTVLEALNIPRLGHETSKKLSKYPDVIKKLANNDENTFMNLHAFIGDANADSINEHREKFMRINFLLDRDGIDWNVIESSNIRVAITGKLSCKRADFEKELESIGISVGSINNETKYLITDDPNSSSEKNRKADKLGIKKITEAEFRKIFSI